MNCLARFLADLRSRVFPAEAGGDGKPVPCHWCAVQVGVEHVLRNPHRYAQVACPRCGASGPVVRFDLSDEWPHIAAERIAVAKWDTMMRGRK